jgi:hypothetical protein
VLVGTSAPGGSRHGSRSRPDQTDLHRARPGRRNYPHRHRPLGSGSDRRPPSWSTTPSPNTCGRVRRRPVHRGLAGATSTDGHPVSGQFSFTATSASRCSRPRQNLNQLCPAGTSSTTGAASSAVRARERIYSVVGRGRRHVRAPAYVRIHPRAQTPHQRTRRTQPAS